LSILLKALETIPRFIVFLLLRLLLFGLLSNVLLFDWKEEKEVTGLFHFVVYWGHCCGAFITKGASSFIAYIYI